MKNSGVSFRQRKRTESKLKLHPKALNIHVPSIGSQRRTREAPMAAELIVFFSVSFWTISCNVCSMMSFVVFLVITLAVPSSSAYLLPRESKSFHRRGLRRYISANKPEISQVIERETESDTYTAILPLSDLVILLAPSVRVPRAILPLHSEKDPI